MVVLSREEYAIFMEQKKIELTLFNGFLTLWDGPTAWMTRQSSDEGATNNAVEESKTKAEFHPHEKAGWSAINTERRKEELRLYVFSPSCVGRMERR